MFNIFLPAECTTIKHMQYVATYFSYEVRTCDMYLSFYFQHYPAENPLEYYIYCRTLAIPFLDCIISELNFRFTCTELSRTVSNLLHLVPSIIVSDCNIQETIKLYETDVHDSCIIDQD